MFANEAALDDGLLVVHGGGWEFFAAESFPTTIGGYIAGVIALDESELDSTPVVRLELGDEEGEIDGMEASMIVGGRRAAPVYDVPSRVPFAIQFATRANGPTLVTARLLAEDEDELASLTFQLRGPLDAEAE